MLRYGLTGGIASGKSTVAAMLRERGFPVLEADKISHALIEPGGAAFEEVLARFGREIVDADGKINRGRLGAMVFRDPEKLQNLNGILHPKVEEELLRRLVELEKSGAVAVAFVEAALIFEAGMDKRLDGVVVAWCLPEQQVARLMERGISEAEARQRMATQMPAQRKLALAAEKIDCSGSIEETRSQVDALATRLRAAASAN
ncbi:MAG TPA: dephospho-CoA kinase [Candidatus Eisenbacteria bacterium]|jgi:dephospho-CoA kinase|nr:dephospho-CoA kinase [Candidatus Eisenbacteria bacterium]